MSKYSRYIPKLIHDTNAIAPFSCLVLPNALNYLIATTIHIMWTSTKISQKRLREDDSKNTQDVSTNTKDVSKIAEDDSTKDKNDLNSNKNTIRNDRFDVIKTKNDAQNKDYDDKQEPKKEFKYKIPLRKEANNHSSDSNDFSNCSVSRSLSCSSVLNKDSDDDPNKTFASKVSVEDDSEPRYPFNGELYISEVAPQIFFGNKATFLPKRIDTIAYFVIDLNKFKLGDVKADDNAQKSACNKRVRHMKFKKTQRKFSLSINVIKETTVITNSSRRIDKRWLVTKMYTLYRGFILSHVETLNSLREYLL